MVYNAINTMTPEYERGAFPGVYSWNGTEWLPIFEKKPTPPPTGGSTDQFEGANCYIVLAGGNTVSIEAQRGLDIWNAYANSVPNSNTGKVLDISSIGTLNLYTAQIEWQETTDGSNSDVVASVSVDNTSDLTINVTSGTKSGNALVSLSNGETGDVIWMWHIWVAESDPTTNPLYFINGAGDEYWLMQTNLGALNNDKTTYNSGDNLTASSHGLYYQWGRHVPFRQFVNTPVYSPSSLTPRQALTYALQNPNFISYFSIASHDWYSSNPTDWNTRWATKDGNNKNIKSPFDPCPKGWRVPYSIGNGSAWQGLNNAAATQEGSGINTSIGYFPYSGYLADGDGKLGNAGENAYIWSANPYLDVNAYNLFVTGTTIQSEYGMNKADALSVRCVRDIAEQ